VSAPHIMRAPEAGADDDADAEDDFLAFVQSLSREEVLLYLEDETERHAAFFALLKDGKK
jgi:hypothetical protein